MSDSILSARQAIWFCWVPTGICAFGAVFISMLPVWAMLAVYTPAMILTAIGVGIVQWRWRQFQEAFDLEDKWRSERDR